MPILGMGKSFLAFFLKHFSCHRIGERKLGEGLKKGSWILKRNQRKEGPL
ncbi:Hypothetical protein Minf_2094 [Methylacidiphilum infernorum V4]|uniref:Uncharacterized protein n=1 Tax=Methylacidiphilum infernorum (isolate V4) TaxID=481448 RepID=B3DZ56_METI4|nr:Hypothetical protein Minf_2094 [Methylacidiphilum infernorum V4]